MSKWKEITTVEEWKKIFENTDKQPIVVLKHSTTCPVSANALDEYEAHLQDHARDDLEYYLVKVIESRPVSNQIAEDVQLKHESPQIIMVKDKEKYWNASHWAITYEHLEAVLH